MKTLIDKRQLNLQCMCLVDTGTFSTLSVAMQKVGRITSGSVSIAYDPNGLSYIF